MEIIIGKNAGFCYGVQTAVDGAIKELEENNKANNKENIYALGEIVHNSEVVKQLEGKGLKVVENIKEANKKVILRAHGVSKEVYNEAKQLGLDIKDFTCKNVLKIHEIAKEYADKGYYIILTGTEKHPENIGTISYCGKDSYILESIENLNRVIHILNNKKIKEEKPKVLLISQTTFSLEKFSKIENKLKQELEKLNIQLIVKNTICGATAIRQKETEDISKKVESMIIIGGKNSSNTKKLYNIAKENTNTYLIETFKELKKEEFVNVKRVGIMAGASTPKESISDVEKFLKNI